MTQKRIGWIDIAKALTIFLIAFGHTLRGGNSLLINFYSFHVACFFMLSGMVCKTDNLRMRILNDVRKILIPYFAFGVLSILIFVVLGKTVSNVFQMDINTSLGKNLLDLLYACPGTGGMQFNMPLWFLPCFFVTKILYYALDKLFRGKQLFILLGSLILYVVGFLCTYFINIAFPLNFAVALKMVFFFSLGRFIFLTLEKYHYFKMKSYLALLLGVVFLAANMLIASFAPTISYAADLFPNALFFTATALLGSLSICLLSIGIGNSKALEYVGQHTLGILVMHKFPILLFQIISPFNKYLTQYYSFWGIAMNVLVAGIAIVLCLLVELFIARFLPFLLGDLSCFTKKRSNRNK